MPSDLETPPDTDAPAPVNDDVTRVEQLFDAGDWRSARAEIARIDPKQLDDAARKRLETLRVRTSTDRVATAIAVVIGLGYLIIIVLLFT